MNTPLKILPWDRHGPNLTQKIKNPVAPYRPNSPLNMGLHFLTFWIVISS